MEMVSSKANNNSSGNKNVYYFLNRIISEQNNELSQYWNKSHKLSESSKQIAKENNKYTISNKHWRITVKTILSKGAEMTNIEKQTLDFLLKLTKEPKDFMVNRYGKQIVSFRNIESEKSFYEKCKGSLYPWLKNLIFEKLIILNGKTNKSEFDAVKEKMLKDYLISDGDKSNDASTSEDECGKSDTNSTNSSDCKNSTKMEEEITDLHQNKKKNFEIVIKEEVNKQSERALQKVIEEFQTDLKEIKEQNLLMSKNIQILWEFEMARIRERSIKESKIN